MKHCDLKIKPQTSKILSKSQTKSRLLLPEQKKMLLKIIEIVNMGWLTQRVPQLFSQLKGMLLEVC